MSWQGIFHRGSADSFEEHADDGPRHAGQRAAGPAAPIRKPWDAWNPGDPEDIENEPSPEDVRGLRPYASGEDEATRGRRPWSRRESEREPQRAWHRTRGEHGGAPFARGQELGLEDELPHEAGQAPGDYGRQSTSRSSGTYSGRVAWRPERTGFPDGRVAWGSGWP
ncbi:MAG TPA: hypothetical protein VK824_03845, partial [Planctomycetota bacterium]|nr:hypothetical protein [Planctomycetota bacterium]